MIAERADCIDKEVVIGKQCGCYHCLALFDGSEIESFIAEPHVSDQSDKYTAICPKCEIDSVLIDVCDEGVLIQMHRKQFGLYFK